MSVALATASSCGGKSSDDKSRDDKSSGGSDSTMKGGAAGQSDAAPVGGFGETGGSGGSSANTGGSADGGASGSLGGAAGTEPQYASAGEDGHFDPLAPRCCADDAYCGSHRRCIKHQCTSDNPYGCWLDDQCAPGELCSGAFLCGCGMICDRGTALGTCVPNDAGCCRDHADCGDSGSCVNGRCMTTVPPEGKCWSYRDCVRGSCDRPTVCPCGAECAAPDVPGNCVYPL